MSLAAGAESGIQSVTTTPLSMVPRRKSKVAPPPATCPLKLCMSFLGGAWTPNIIWYLSGGPRRFSELKHDLSGVSAKMLTQCLRHLVEIGVVERQEQPSSPPTVEYSLSSIGCELKPAIESIVRVGEKLKRLRKN
jgi:DNA-binding HxlR family transcriptional regulator